MKLIHPEKQTNFNEKLRPLFEAMKKGERIKLVICMRGIDNKDNLEKDFKIEDFVAKEYWTDFSQNRDESIKDDRVTTDKGQDFYMSWVRYFEF